MKEKEPKTAKIRKVHLSSAIVGGAIALAAGFGLGLNWDKFAPYLTFGSNNTISFNSDSTTVDWSSLNEVYQKLVDHYDGDIDKSEVLDGAKAGLVAALGDRYTTYMTASQASDYDDSLHGKVGAGIGVSIRKSSLNDYTYVVRTLPDNPARKAGVLAGDIIYKVDGEEVYDNSVDEIAKKIRGETGSEVTVTVVRDGKEKSFTMKRESINNVSAYVEYDGKTAIITVTRFDNDTGKLVQEFAADFDDKGVNKVILDLRGNGGGYVSAAQDLLSLWLDNQKILIQKSRHYGNTTTNSSSGKAILSDTKTVVLVNGSTASASEIVAGALQDYEKATIVGETTFGKGVVQNLFDLSGGTVLKVTTAEWYTPNDRSINKTGITPDIEVERSYEDINAMRDPQLDKAKSL